MVVTDYGFGYSPSPYNITLTPNWEGGPKAMSKKSGSKTRTVNKSAITGRFISNAAVARHPKTSYKQTVKKSK